MIDWDDPQNLPRTSAIGVGQSVEGVVTALQFEPNMRGAMTLTYTLDHGIKRWCNSQLWKALGHARIQVGDRVRITRGPDEPGTGQYPRTTWTVERRQAPQPVQQPQPPQWAAPQPQPVQQVPAW